MKYNDNGEVKNIVVKAADSLPVGTIVEYDGDSIPAGYEEIDVGKIRKTYQGVVPTGKVLNSESSSLNDTYSCAYINNKFNEISTYSTEEQVIGTWIDGKHLYRKVITGTINDTKKFRFITNTGDIEKLIDYKGFINQNNQNIFVKVGSTISPEDISFGYATRLLIFTYNIRLDADGTNYSNSSFEIAIEYTKTTD